MGQEVKKALITGLTGQDGSYLAEFLLSKGDEVHGVIRRASSFNTPRISHLIDGELKNREGRFFFHYGDTTDATCLIDLVQKIKPDEIYNLAAQSHVRVSFDAPEYTSNADALGTLRLLEAIRLLGLSEKIKFYQASTSELFGKVQEIPQTELTAFYPRSPYAVAKLYAFWITKNYREAYGIFGCNGILFNHEGPRRGETFVTRKITRFIARAKAGLDKKLLMGNLEAKRDWGFAPEYVASMWRMLQAPEPDDYVVATGEQHSVKEFLTEAFQYAGLGDWQQFVEVDPRYFRPTEADSLLGNPAKAKEKLVWEPKIKFKELVRIMVDADLRALGLPCPGEGDRIIQEKFPDKWWQND